MMHAVQLSHEQVVWLADQSPSVIYKEDRRTRVFAVQHEGRTWVVKRFAHARWWQAAMWLVRMHPAQREARRVRQLQALRLPVVSINGLALRWRGLGGVGYCVSPFMGESVFRQLNRNMLVDAAKRRELAAALAVLTAELLQHGLVHDDYKSSNILRDGAGTLWLIDTDRVARSRDPQRVMAMLRTLDETATRARATRTERWRFASSLAKRMGWDARAMMRGEIQPAKV